MNSKLPQPEFLPTTKEEMSALGWTNLDVLLISGDAYVDSHSFGTSLLGRWLIANGFKTGIIAQPSWTNISDITRMGRPRLFAGISAGAVDSLIAHYTAFRKKRSTDAYSPGGKTDLRPNRASIVYTGLVRQAFAGLPVILGGIEASLRRASHYDFWSDQLRKSILLDSKADAVLYGMGEKSILRYAIMLDTMSPATQHRDALARSRIAGSAYTAHPDAVPTDAFELPSHEAILADRKLLIRTTMAFERQMLQGGPCLVQRAGGRIIVYEPPSEPLTVQEMDDIYSLPFTRRAHPSYKEPIPAAAMMEASIVSHRGCGGGCSFCSLAIHQGRTIQSRSAQSIMQELQILARSKGFKGSITDVGGPSANMWQATCKGDRTTCTRVSCLWPKRCRNFHAPQMESIHLLRAIAKTEGVNNVRIGSGIRLDLALESEEYMRAVISEFTGGQLKVAPEHINERTLERMRKPAKKTWETFLKQFIKISAEAGKEQYIVPYLMSAFPGCSDDDMKELAGWLAKKGWRPQQVQCFIPSPGTVATAMFYAKADTDGRDITVARTDAERLRQHGILIPAEPKKTAPHKNFSPHSKRPFSKKRDFGKPGKFRHDADKRPKHK